MLFITFEINLHVVCKFFQRNKKNIYRKNKSVPDKAFFTFLNK